VVAADALMSFFGSMGNDSGFSSWTTDITNERNRGQLGAILAALPVIATIVGTVGSGLLIDLLGYFAFFIVMGALVILVGVLGLFFMEEGSGLKPNRDEKGFWNQFFAVFNFRTLTANKELFWVFLIMTAYFTGFNAFAGLFDNAESVSSYHAHRSTCSSCERCADVSVPDPAYSYAHIFPVLQG
jgi:MFS family permease